MSRRLGEFSERLPGKSPHSSMCLVSTVDKNHQIRRQRIQHTVVSVIDALGVYPFGNRKGTHQLESARLLEIITAVPKCWCHSTWNSCFKILVPFAICHCFGAQSARVFWNKIEEPLFGGAEVFTIYVSFSRLPWSNFPRPFCVAPREDERTGKGSKIENFSLVSLIQPPTVKWHRYFGMDLVHDCLSRSIALPFFVLFGLDSTYQPFTSVASVISESTGFHVPISLVDACLPPRLID